MSGDAQGQYTFVVGLRRMQARKMLSKKWDGEEERLDELHTTNNLPLNSIVIETDDAAADVVCLLAVPVLTRLCRSLAALRHQVSVRVHV
eukprot:m.318839 g.318839  ORF g.318839 m.318839 type:complete len:90 (+) comp15990_c0_seq38:4043-4312(+)